MFEQLAFFEEISYWENLFPLCLFSLSFSPAGRLVMTGSIVKGTLAVPDRAIHRAAFPTVFGRKKSSSSSSGFQAHGHGPLPFWNLPT